MKKNIVILIILLFLQLYAIPYTLYPAHAASCTSTGGVDIGACFGFGDFTSLGQATSSLVPAFFSIATFLVIMYFLAGAFKYLRAGGNKEEVEGGKQMIVHAIIGFMLLMLSFLVLQFVLSSLFETNTFRIF